MAFLFATLAGLLKISAYISFIAIGLVFIISTIKFKRIKSFKFILILSFCLLSILTIGAWFYYAHYYNQLNQSNYFFLKSAPIWDLTLAERTTVWSHISNWTKEFFYPTGRHIFYALLFLSIIPYKINKDNVNLYLISLIGILCFTALFFPQFKNHDYYVVTLFFLFPMVLVTFLSRLSILFSNNYKVKYTSHLLLFSLLIANTIYAKNRNDKRFSKKSDWVFEELYDVEPQLQEFGFEKANLVLAPFDPSANITFYALKRKGWTRLNGITNKKAIQDKQNLGAEWIVIPLDSLKESGYLNEFIDKPAFSTEKVAIYRLIKPHPQN